MAERLYLDESNLRDMGWNEPNIRLLRKITEFIDTQTRLGTAEAAIVTQGTAIDAANTDIATANTAINALDGRIDAYDALAPFVRQDQAAAPAFTPYAGQTVSNPPTQAETQAIDNAAVALGVAVDALKTALQTAQVLT